MSLAGQSSSNPVPLWPLMHLFYRIDFGAWSILSTEEQIAAKTHLSELVQEIRSHKHISLHVFGMLTPKADVGFLIASPDIQEVHAFEKRLTQALGPDILVPAYSFLSQLTWESDCVLMAHSPEEAESVCFFPVGVQRVDPGDRAARIETTTAESLRRAVSERAPEFPRTAVWISAAGGLEEEDWGVTIFAPGLPEIAAWVAGLREDTSLRGSEMGDCYVGLALPLDALFRRVQI